MSIKGRLVKLEKVANPHHRGCLVILRPDGSMPELPKWAKDCKTFVILPAKEGLDEESKRTT